MLNADLNETSLARSIEISRESKLIGEYIARYSRNMSQPALVGFMCQISALGWWLPFAARLRYELQIDQHKDGPYYRTYNI